MKTRLLNQRKVDTLKATPGTGNQGNFTYRGFSSNETTKNFKKYDIDLVKQDLINHFHIRKGEKLENPTFGTIIWDVLFEQFTDEVKKAIAQNVEEIINHDPRCAVRYIAVDSTDMGIRIEADLVYLPFNVSERIVFNFDRENGLVN